MSDVRPLSRALTSSARVRVNDHLSNSSLSRGVTQGSVLPPTLFLTVMDLLLKQLCESMCGLIVRGTHLGAAVHTDDLRTTARSLDSVCKQDTVINSFASDSCLKLNTTKCEVVRISPLTHETTVVLISNSDVSTSDAAKCLGVWWNSSLSAKHSIIENITKAQRAFFALGRLDAFQDDLTPYFMQHL